MVYLIERHREPIKTWLVMFNHAEIGMVVERADIGRWLAALTHGGHVFLAGIHESRDEAKAEVVRRHHRTGQNASYKERFPVLHDMDKPIRHELARLTQRRVGGASVYRPTFNHHSKNEVEKGSR